MSWWILPTTADIGIRAFSSNPLDLLREVTFGFQEIQLSDEGNDKITTLNHHTGQWSIPLIDEDLERGLVLWLEEVLFRGSIEDKWLIDVSFKISDLAIDAYVSWVDSKLVSREIEIKAVTMHELMFKEMYKNEILNSTEVSIPAFEGPGWVAQVVLDV
jgi:SHS2 domain-containing protein|tara:strand:+ start:5851 stop:6327 length:477 start_codon:yes stop_codon:yes gene_type:complete